MEHESSDILGHDTMLAVDANQRGGYPFSANQSVFIVLALWATYALGKRVWKRVLLWRERSYKLATRRRHGIPDSDLRPFNVAYTEAVMRAREEESKKIKPQPALRRQTSTADQRDTTLESNVRHRLGAQQGLSRNSTAPAPGAFPGPTHPRNNVSTRTTLANTESSSTRGRATEDRIDIQSGLARQPAYRDLAPLLTESEGRKRTLDEQIDEPEAKKTRVEGDELIDGDEDAHFQDYAGRAAAQRGSKRGMREEEDTEEAATKKSRGKRARNVSLEQARPPDESMEIDDEEEADEVPELPSHTRGKKRDRAEAGSTFGGDDDDSAAEDDAKARRRRRKRRTVAKRKSEASYLRGKKRERDGDEDVSGEESEESSPAKASRKKRGKRDSHAHHRNDDDETKSDVSMDESTTSNRGKARNIGDEWECNGIRYKIGLNNQRLRQALVKKARQKFVMPKDSQHPDRDANLQVCIECWLTEEEYLDAKAKHLLAWQDSPKRSEEPGDLSIDISDDAVPFPGIAPGKDLLWSASPTPTPGGSPASYAHDLPPVTRRNHPRHSIATSVGIPINPFTNTHAPAVRRIASTSRAPNLSSGLYTSPGLSDSTNGSPRTPLKVFSKWEKQELEAKAMSKLREAGRKKDMEREAKLKEERDRAEREKQEKDRQERERAERARLEKERLEREKAERKAKEAAAAAAASTQSQQVPNITITPPSSENVTAPAPAASTSSSSIPNFFSINPAAPSVPKPAPASSSSQSSTVPDFFSKPSQPVSTSTAPASSQPPKFTFAVPTPATASTSSTAQPSPFGFNANTSAPKGEEKKDAGATSAFSSNASNPLLSRMGPPATASNAKAETPSTNASQSSGAFSFANPQASNPFGQNTATMSAFPSTGAANGVASSTPAAAAATTTPKFNFGFGTKTAASAAPSSTTPATSAFSASTSSSLSGALGSVDPSKSSTSTNNVSNFGFKTPAAPASAPAPANSSTSTLSSNHSAVTAPKFNFGVASSPSPFGAAATQPQPAKSSFGSNAMNTSNAFGGSTGTAPTPFGANSAPGSGVASSSPFASSSNSNNALTNSFGKTSAEAPKSAFSFGTPQAGGKSSSEAVPAASTPAPTSNSKFSFGVTSTPTTTTSTTPASTPASGASAFSFKFGQTASTTPQSSPFGTVASSGQSAFGNAASTQNQTNPPSVFGGGSTFGSSLTQQQK